MTCFWDGLIQSLDQNYLYLFNNSKPNVNTFIQYLKDNNILCSNVNCNNYILSIKFLYECFDTIKNYDINDSCNGYLCSTCDPFLILYSQLFNININHNYNGNNILYKNYNNKDNIIKYFESNIGHFWFIK